MLARALLCIKGAGKGYWMDIAASSASSEPHVVRSWRMERASEASRVQETDGLGFGDFVDLINPLHHIPLVGTLYRALTGDEIKPAVQVAGGLLYGVLTGSVLVSGATSIASAAYEQSTGNEPTIQLAQALFGEETVQDTPTDSGFVALAQAEFVGQASVETVGQAPKEALVMEAYQPAPEKQMIIASAAQPVLPVETRVATRGAEFDGQTLGLMLQEQAKTHQAGQALPPELVHDMMLRVFDKYAAAQTLSGSAAIP